MFPNMHSRLAKEISKIQQQYNLEIKVRKDERAESNINNWIGGSILGSLTCNTMWAYRSEYDEHGIV